MFNEDDVIEAFEDEVTETKEPKKKKSLGDLLELMRKAEDDLDDFEIDLDELGQDIRSKVDAIVDFLDYCEHKADILKKRMKLFEKKAKAFENKAKNLRQYVANQLMLDSDQKGDILGQKEEMPTIAGDLYQISLQFRDYVETLAEANPLNYLKLSEFIERRYSWNKRALKTALENQNEKAFKVAKIGQRPHLKIDVKC